VIDAESRDHTADASPAASRDVRSDVRACSIGTVVEDRSRRASSAVLGEVTPIIVAGCASWVATSMPGRPGSVPPTAAAMMAASITVTTAGAYWRSVIRRPPQVVEKVIVGIGRVEQALSGRSRTGGRLRLGVTVCDVVRWVYDPK